MEVLRVGLALALAVVAACKPPNVVKAEEKLPDGGTAGICGNGVVEPGEVCDPPGPRCSADCKSDLSCGNLVVDPGEVCDDGNHTDCDGCSHDCKSDETCGNKYVDACRGEECDDGIVALTGACPKCKNARCGDGYVWAGKEQCDDGTNALTGACPRCKNAYCGDGYVWAGHEQCDEGPAPSDNGACPGKTNGNPTCVAAYCGDNYVWNTEGGGEQCDEGPTPDPAGACPASCVAAYCGDGYVWTNEGGTEQCDHGASNGQDGLCSGVNDPFGFAPCQCYSGVPPC